ncbi:MAG: hypothetical protein AMJ43_07865 [Coxiella sp. DG_40]|nr:MAG: hypothetical protein AMJ43_07865 [Coxiella sp. DG_40]
MKKNHLSEKLIQAAKFNDAITCHMLLVDGADPCYRNGLAYLFAAKNNNHEIIDMFVDECPRVIDFSPKARMLANNRCHILMTAKMDKFIEQIVDREPKLTVIKGSNSKSDLLQYLGNFTYQCLQLNTNEHIRIKKIKSSESIISLG